ncbi:hypothetical protein C7212DRAFT_355041 [Tuber magnatum]|uniref:DUF7702 domain-containing protein n=1 Tax=Tuber magnatum TaxID=42249 RepID=A0A317SBI7_9PEZI|nr:hypothetical protein C7212DRAFT_355041 [Tuber magnatum]
MTPHANLFLSEVILGIAFLSLTAHNISRTPLETAWWYIAIFCLFRTTGSALLLTVTLKQLQIHKSLIVPAIVFSGIAVSLLLAACLGFLNSCTQHLPTSHHPILRLLTLTHLLVLAALILNTIGGVLIPLHSTTTTSSPPSAAFAWTARAFYLAVLGAMPCLFVRILYAVLAAWDLGKGGAVVPGGGNRYGVLKGDVGVLAGMRVCMEFLVVGGWGVVGILEWWW